MERESRAGRGDGEDRGVEVEEVPLPGIGVRYSFMTRHGRQVGVVSRRTGRRELLVYDAADPDTCREVVVLGPDEADALAELLGAPRIVEKLAALDAQLPDLVTEQLPVAASSPFAGRALGETRARTLTGASIVAVQRGGRLVPSPGPDSGLEAGDLVVVVGTREGVDGVARILGG